MSFVVTVIVGSDRPCCCRTQNLLKKKICFFKNRFFSKVFYNGHPVYIKLRNPNVDNAGVPNLAIWWNTNAWYIGLLSELGQNRGFATVSENTNEPFLVSLPWRLGNGVGFNPDTSVVCRPGADFYDSIPAASDVLAIKEQVRRDLQQEADQSGSAVLKVTGVSADEVYEHVYDFQRSTVNYAEDRRKNFLHGVALHQYLARHPLPQVRLSVVPFYWASIPAGSGRGIIWMGKGAPINWASLTLTVRKRGIIQLWENLAAFHEAGVTHRDIKCANVVNYCNRWTFIDLDNSVPELPDARAAAPFIPTLGVTNFCPENFWTSIYKIPEGSPTFATDVFLLSVLSCDILFPGCPGTVPRGPQFTEMWNKNVVAPPHNLAVFAASTSALVKGIRHGSETWRPALLQALAPNPADRPSAQAMLDMLRLA